MHYTEIKRHAQQQKVRVTDLIALAPHNDPFYVGTPAARKWGQWFADLWKTFGYTAGVHIRRVHYQIISQAQAVPLPNGMLYANTEECWNQLTLASKAARYLGLVDAAAFVDRRNPDPVLLAPVPAAAAAITVDTPLWEGALDFPAFPALPDYRVEHYHGRQAYHLEVWCEKSTMNDILRPLCARFEANLVTGLGELSVTATVDVVQRVEASGKPARILYLADFDPAGAGMPVSVARKLEFFLQGRGLDVALFPIALTADQVRQYTLPRIPIKLSERRKRAFETHYGTGAVELDALEALHPGALAQLVQQALEAFWDSILAWRVMQAEDALADTLAARRHDILAAHARDLATLRAEHDQMQAALAERLAAYQRRVEDLWARMAQELTDGCPPLDAFPIPTAESARVVRDALFESTRDYWAQLEYYKAWQGKTPAPARRTVAVSTA